MKDLLDGSKRLPPGLPPGAAAKHLGGQVELRVSTAKSGEVWRAIVTHPSGSLLLDETARTWVQYIWRYPAAGEEKIHQEQISFKTTDAAVEVEERGASLTRPFLPNTPRPPYPYIARKMNWQGDVHLELVPDGKGGVLEAKIVASSGVLLLDLVAKVWIESYWKLPGGTGTACVLKFKIV